MADREQTLGGVVTNEPQVESDALPRSQAGSTDVENEPTAAREEVARAHVREDPSIVTVTPRDDQVRWGSVWAGVVTALATFLLVELVFFALGWLTFGEDLPGSSNSVAWMTSVTGALAFVVGGFVAGMTAMWRGLGTGLLHGVLVWALGIVSIVLVSLLGGGALFGAFSGVLGEITALQNALGQGNADIPAAAVSTARDMARWAVLALVIFLAASSLGGMLGAKTSPRRKQGGTVDVRR